MVPLFDLFRLSCVSSLEYKVCQKKKKKQHSDFLTYLDNTTALDKTKT